VSNRRTRFREHMVRLNAAASPQQALDSGFYVSPPAELSIAHELSARLELQPASTHLVIGGVGSGKTTELLTACRKLAEDEEIAAIYVDVSETNDLADLDGYTLLLALMIGLDGYLTDRRDHHPQINIAISQYDRWLSESADGAEISAYQNEKTFTDLLAAFTHIKRTPVVFVDSLDRLPDPLKLEAALREHANLLRKSRLGLVLAGSIRLRHGLDRSLRDLFDQLYSAPYINTDEASGLEFLTSILRARVPPSLIDDAHCQQLARLSGGVLRDLITLAQAAVNETYIRGGEQVTSDHIGIAADSFGRKQMLGLDSEEIETLQRVRARGTFVQTSAKDLSLLLTRHVLEYQDANGKTVYKVHPTIKSLLEQIAGAA
jgi:type II secretory pathway predicted ATPase ExeA